MRWSISSTESEPGGCGGLDMRDAQHGGVELDPVEISDDEAADYLAQHDQLQQLPSGHHAGSRGSRSPDNT